MGLSRAFFQRVAASLVIPLTLLPLAAILLALGSQLGLGPLEAAGLSLIRTWLPLFYGMGIAIGFGEGDGMAALAVATGYLTMISVAEQVAGYPGLNVGVLGGVITGALMTWLFNRVKGISLPEYLALFSGKRLGLFLGPVLGLLLGLLFGLFWPPIHQAIASLGDWIAVAGGLGAFVYGAVLRLLIPTGLHHLLMQLVDFQLGGWTDPATGQLVVGEYLRFLSGDPSAGRLLSGFFLTLGFGPVGAALAITHEARPEQRRRVAGLMATGALTAAVLGITEPVEFAFIFASPVLFGLHLLLSGLASLVGYLLEIHLGGYALPMILINWHRQQNGWLLLPLGILWSLLYYVSFRLVIRWRRPAILGQSELVEERVGPGAGLGVKPGAAPPAGVVAGVGAVLPGGSAHPDTEAGQYLAALGGAGNLRSLTACMTRLRCEVREPAAVDDAALRRLGAVGVLRASTSVQVVVGARASELLREVEALVEGRSGRSD